MCGRLEIGHIQWRRTIDGLWREPPLQAEWSDYFQPRISWKLPLGALEGDQKI